MLQLWSSIPSLRNLSLLLRPPTDWWSSPKIWRIIGFTQSLLIKLSITKKKKIIFTVISRLVLDWMTGHQSLTKWHVNLTIMPFHVHSRIPLQTFPKLECWVRRWKKNDSCPLQPLYCVTFSQAFRFQFCKMGIIIAITHMIVGKGRDKVYVKHLQKCLKQGKQAIN